VCLTISLSYILWAGTVAQCGPWSGWKEHSRTVTAWRQRLQLLETDKEEAWQNMHEAFGRTVEADRHIYTYDAGFLMFLDVTGNEMPKPCKMILVGNSKSIIPFFGLARPRNMKK